MAYREAEQITDRDFIRKFVQQSGMQLCHSLCAVMCFERTPTSHKHISPDELQDFRIQYGRLVYHSLYIPVWGVFNFISSFSNPSTHSFSSLAGVYLHWSTSDRRGTLWTVSPLYHRVKTQQYRAANHSHTLSAKDNLECALNQKALCFQTVGRNQTAQKRKHTGKSMYNSLKSYCQARPQTTNRNYCTAITRKLLQLYFYLLSCFNSTASCF